MSADPRRVAVDMSVQVIGRFANLLLGVVVIVLLTRELGVDGFGQWSALLATTQIAGYLGELGLEPAAVRRGAADGADRPAVLGALLALRMAMSVIATAVAVAAIVVLADGSGEMFTAGILVAAATVAAALSSVRVIFQLRVRNDLPIIVMTINSVLWAGAVVGIALAGVASLIAFSVAMLAVNVVTSVLLLVLALRSTALTMRDFRVHARGLLRVGLVLGLGQLLTYAYVRVDQALVLAFTDERQAGFYGAAYQILDKAQFLPTAVLTTLLPLLVAAHDADREQLSRLVGRAFELLALVSLPVLAFAVVAAEPFVVLLYGADFREAGRALPILMAAFVLTSFGYLLGNLALVLGTQGRFVVIASVALAFNVIVNVVLLPHLGYLVAAWTTVATEVLVVVLAVPVTLGRMQIRVPLGRLPRVALASALMALVVGVLHLQGAPIGWLLAAGAVAYPVAVVALRAVPTADLRTLVGR